MRWAEKKKVRKHHRVDYSFIIIYLSSKWASIQIRFSFGEYLRNSTVHRHLFWCSAVKLDETISLVVDTQSWVIQLKCSVGTSPQHYALSLITIWHRGRLWTMTSRRLSWSVVQWVSWVAAAEYGTHLYHKKMI